MPPSKKNKAKQPVEEEEEEEQQEEMGANEALMRLLNPNRVKDFIASLEPDVRNRVHALQGLQKKYEEIHGKYLEESAEISRKFNEKAKPVLDQRKEIINGNHEPSDDEVKAGLPTDGTVDPLPEKVTETGIPEFWLKVLQSHTGFSDLITDKDEAALKFLTDITCTEANDLSAFTLEFTFKPNEFFENTTLTKKYNFVTEPPQEPVFDKAEGTTINWKAGKNLTVTLKKTKTGKKGKNQRVVTKEEKCDSFFNFFTPINPEELEDEDEMEGAEDLINSDYELGEDLRYRIIPFAVDWLTGVATDDYDMEMDEEDEEDEGDEEGEEGGNNNTANANAGEAGAAGQGECKQQ